QANHILGEWTAKNIGGNTLVLSSVYDTGYDALDTFHQSFSKHGGNIQEFILQDVTDINWDRIPHHNISSIYASFSGKQADMFWKAYRKSRLNHIPVIASPFTLMDHQGHINPHAYNATTLIT